MLLTEISINIKPLYIRMLCIDNYYKQLRLIFTQDTETFILISTNMISEVYSITIVSSSGRYIVIPRLVFFSLGESM